VHVLGTERDNTPPIPTGLEFEPDLVFCQSVGMEVPLGGEGGPQFPALNYHDHGGDGLGGSDGCIGGNGWGARDGWARGYDEDDPLPEVAMRQGNPPPQRVQLLRRPGRLPTLDISDSDSSEGEMEGGIEDINGVRHMYRDDIWTKEKFAFDPPPMEFTGIGGPRGPIFHRIPTFMMLFRLF
jgi:hypothetical protein